MDTKLYRLLATHDKIEKEVINLDETTTSLSQKIFSAANQSDELCLLLRLSVAEGVQHMYKEFHDNTKQKMLQCSMTDDPVVVETNTSSNASSTHSRSTTMDKAADAWTAMFCEFYRGS